MNQDLSSLLGWGLFLVVMVFLSGAVVGGWAWLVVSGQVF